MQILFYLKILIKLFKMIISSSKLLILVFILRLIALFCTLFRLSFLCSFFLLFILNLCQHSTKVTHWSTTNTHFCSLLIKIYLCYQALCLNVVIITYIIKKLKQNFDLFMFARLSNYKTNKIEYLEHIVMFSQQYNLI